MTYNRIKMILTQAQEDSIYNALIIGMALDDAYIYAGLSPTQIEGLATDTEHQLRWKQLTKQFEYGLLDNMKTIAERQIRMGKEAATTWMLEKMFPRYSGKPAPESGEVHLHFNDRDPAELSTVEIHRGKPTDGNT